MNNTKLNSVFLSIYSLFHPHNYTSFVQTTLTAFNLSGHLKPWAFRIRTLRYYFEWQQSTTKKSINLHRKCIIILNIEKFAFDALEYTINLRENSNHTSKFFCDFLVWLLVFSNGFLLTCSRWISGSKSMPLFLFASRTTTISCAATDFALDLDKIVRLLEFMLRTFFVPLELDLFCRFGESVIVH